MSVRCDIRAPIGTNIKREQGRDTDALLRTVLAREIPHAGDDHNVNLASVQSVWLAQVKLAPYAGRMMLFKPSPTGDYYLFRTHEPADLTNASAPWHVRPKTGQPVRTWGVGEAFYIDELEQGAVVLVTSASDFTDVFFNVAKIRR